MRTSKYAAYYGKKSATKKVKFAQVCQQGGGCVCCCGLWPGWPGCGDLRSVAPVGRRLCKIENIHKKKA